VNSTRPDQRRTCLTTAAADRAAGIERGVGP
jgi:hypothetical protein